MALFFSYCYIFSNTFVIQMESISFFSLDRWSNYKYEIWLEIATNLMITATVQCMYNKMIQYIF